MKSKRGEFELDTVKNIFVIILILGVLAVVSIVILSSFTGMQIRTDEKYSTDNFLGQNGTSKILTYTPTTLTVQAYNQTWLQFDGTDDYVNMSKKAELDIGQGTFTISFWLNAKNVSNNVLPRILEKRSNYIAIMGDGTNARFTQLALELANQTGSNTLEVWSRGQNITLNVWEHWAIVYNGTDGMWYKNGVANDNLLELNVSGEWTGTEGNSSGYDFLIGRRRTDLARNLNGSLDEIRVYNRNLSASEINEIYLDGRQANSSINSTGLVLWISENENSGTTAYDKAIGNNGSIKNGATYQTDGINVTLTAGTDYSLTSNIFKLMNINHEWDYLNLAYVYENDTDELVPITNNVIAGFPKFFNNVPTFMILLGVVVIILIISIVIISVNKLNGTSEYGAEVSLED